MIKRICICGGGSLGHAIAGYLASGKDMEVSLLTRQPEKWYRRIEVRTPDGKLHSGHLQRISGNPREVIPYSDMVLLCLPGYAIGGELDLISPWLREGTSVGSIFCSTGFFYEAFRRLPEKTTLWGFQRVPFIARTEIYGKRGAILGYKPEYKIAVERSDDKERVRSTVERIFNRPTHLLNNFYEASFTNSNPLLHPARLYSLFRNWKPGDTFDREILFYSEWDNEASQNLIDMDKDLFRILATLPVNSDFLSPILTYYESSDASSLTAKIRSIESFRDIKAPLIQESDGRFVPDFGSRYFQEDITYGLRYIREEAIHHGIPTPAIDKVYEWAVSMLKTHGIDRNG